MQNGKISFSQLMSMAFLSALGPVIRLLPWAFARFGGGASFLALLPAAGILYTFIYGISRLLRRGQPGVSLWGLLRASGGPVIGTAVCLLLGLWLLAYTAFTLRSGVERLISCVYTEGKPWLLSTVMAALAAAAASGRLKSLAGAGRVLALLLGAVMVLVCALALPGVRVRNLLPDARLDWSGLLWSALAAVNVLSVGVYFLVFLGDTEPRTLRPGPARLAALAGLLVCLAVTVVTVGTLSAPVTEKLQFPFFVLIRNIRELKIAERFEALVIAVWVGADFMLLASLLFMLRRLAETVTGRGCRPVPALAAAAANAAGMLVSDDAFTVHRLSKYAIPLINIVVVFGVIPIMLRVGKKAKKR